MNEACGVHPPASHPKLAPGLVLVAVITTTAYLAARAPLLSVVGPLILALVIGMLVRRWRGIRQNEVAGESFAARTLLRVGRPGGRLRLHLV